MSDANVITVQEISKAYQIYDDPRDRLKQFIWPRIRRGIGLPVRNYYRDFWALQDISFNLRQGETIGIIGRNGSGKSTLLQIICGTMAPTAGTVDVRGRVAALLELGAGFNPEFTGRENVYLNAAVLGLTPSDIAKRFDQIVAFADIGQFIEQPVKTYSSGMLVRLAFAVIAHVDADLLVVDEALAVGDAVFSQKCMRWLRAFQARGSLLFVSHDTAAVKALCDRAIWLHEGRCREQGGAKDITESYLRYTFQEMTGDAVKLDAVESEAGIEAGDAVIDYGPRLEIRQNVADARGWKTGLAEVTSVTIENLSSPGDPYFEGGESVQLRIQAKAHAPIDRPILGFLLRDRLGQDLFGENTLALSDPPPSVPAGKEIEGTFRFRLPMLPNGHYEVMASVADGDLYNHVQHHWLNDAMIIYVTSSKVRYGLVGLQFQHVSIRVTDAR